MVVKQLSSNVVGSWVDQKITTLTTHYDKSLSSSGCIFAKPLTGKIILAILNSAQYLIIRISLATGNRLPRNVSDQMHRAQQLCDSVRANSTNR